MKTNIEKTKNNVQEETNNNFMFKKINYILLLAGVVLMAIGYLCLIGGGSDDPNVFNESIFSVRRMYVAPILIILGLIVEVFAIMVRSNKE
jgi:hypothetical protein